MYSACFTHVLYASDVREREEEKGCLWQTRTDEWFYVLWKLNMALTLLPCSQMVPVEGGWLSEAGNLRMLMLGGQFYATPSLLSPGAWIWYPLAAPVSGPLPPSSSLPPARLTEPKSPLLIPLCLHPGIDFPPPDSVWPGLVEYLDRWVHFGRCQVHDCGSMGVGTGRGRREGSEKTWKSSESTFSNVQMKGPFSMLDSGWQKPLVTQL